MNDFNKTKRTAERQADDAAGAYDDVKERLSGLADDARSSGEELAQKARARGTELLGDLQDRGQEVWKDVRKWAKKNPSQAVVCGIAAGVLLYTLFLRSDD